VEKETKNKIPKYNNHGATEREANKQKYKVNLCNRQKFGPGDIYDGANVDIKYLHDRIHQGLG
jgi:hypothetical protein